MKLKNVVRSLGVAGAAGLSMVQGAYADLPAAVTTQFTETTSDVTTAGGLIITLAVVAMGIRWVKATFF